MLVKRRLGQHAATINLHILAALLTLSCLSNALSYVPGSPCAAVCATEKIGTIQNDTVCLDADYRDTTNGENVQTCVACLLNSTTVNSGNGETDVQWGLFTLRYALASCMFGIPEERVSISSPCQVTCAPLSTAIGHDLTTNSSNVDDPSLSFCTAGRFDDTTINKCAFCYSLIDEQLYLANFLQALHIACRETPTSGAPFYPDARSIFNQTLISGPAPPTPSSTDDGDGGVHGSTLALVIALPIVGGILILGGGCWGCWVFTRRRRRRMAASGRMSRVLNAQAEETVYSPVGIGTANGGWGENEPPREMTKLSPRVTEMTDQQNVYPSSSPRFMQQQQQHQYEQQYPPGTALSADSPREEQSTPLRTSFHQREDVGPGVNQIQDPNLHERYFGVVDEGEDEFDQHRPQHPVAANGNIGLGMYSDREPGYQGSFAERQAARGHWIQ